jgi:hypothetical protein
MDEHYFLERNVEVSSRIFFVTNELRQGLLKKSPRATHRCASLTRPFKLRRDTASRTSKICSQKLRRQKAEEAAGLNPSSPSAEVVVKKRLIFLVKRLKLSEPNI